MQVMDKSETDVTENVTSINRDTQIHLAKAMFRSKMLWTMDIGY